MEKGLKQLLLIDLCARLPYGVVMNVTEPGEDRVNFNCFLGPDIIKEITSEIGHFKYKPYLRPMSSMTEEEKEELLNLLFDKEAKYFYIDEEGFIDGKTSDLMKEGFNYPSFCPINIELYTDFLLSHHFDFRGLIEKGLALEALEGVYNIKKK